MDVWRYRFETVTENHSQAQPGPATQTGVKAITGLSIGGAPPFEHKSSLPVYVDKDLTRFEVVWAAAGTPFAVFAITPEELVRASGGTVADLAADQ